MEPADEGSRKGGAVAVSIRAAPGDSGSKRLHYGQRRAHCPKKVPTKAQAGCHRARSQNGAVCPSRNAATKTSNRTPMTSAKIAVPNASTSAMRLAVAWSTAG